MTDVIVIGAGAAGLAAASHIAAEGIPVTILEARKRAGGRVYTITDEYGEHWIEGGAEFIHGNQATTLALLQEYGIRYAQVNGKVWHVHHGDAEKDKTIITEEHQLLEKKLKAVRRDLSLQDFLDKHFSDEKFSELRASVIGFAEGYESAEAKYFSTLAFRETWQEAEKWKQFRIEGGYSALVRSMKEDCQHLGCEIRFSSVVQTIRWKKDHVKITCSNGKVYTANKCVMAVPLSILQQRKIKFIPSLPEKALAIKDLQYGDVIKILLVFKEKFWEHKDVENRTGEKMKDLLFLFSKAAVPTWWTQSPSAVPLLTGWLSGPEAKKVATKTNTQLINIALKSLAGIFQTDVKFLRKQLQSWKVFNWSKDPFTLGSYSYATVTTKQHIKEMHKPVDKTLFFAGEYMSAPVGTVESALKSGMDVADRVVGSLRKK